MLSRLYIVQMPGESPTTPLDILVQSNPGSPSAPVVTGEGKYYELRGRDLRLEALAADGAAGGFVPRLRLGFTVSVTPYSANESVAVPGVQLSESLVGDLSSTDSGPSINIPVLSDPNGEPVIRLVGSSDTNGLFYLVSLQANEAREDNRPRGGG